MTLTLNIFNGTDLYEVYVRDQTILRIIKWYGQSQHQRQLSFEECPKKVQAEIITKIAQQ